MLSLAKTLGILSFTPLTMLQACAQAIDFKVGHHFGEGQGVNLHTPHWHGNVVLDGGKRTDVIFIGPAQMETVDMVPDDPGTWMYHCHFDEHMKAGMMALYKVEP